MGMIASLLLAAAAPAIPPVPGGCTEPAADNQGKPGCFLSAQLTIAAPPETLYWHIVAFERRGDAEAEARRHASTAIVTAHGRVWLHILSDDPRRGTAGVDRAVIGPFRLAAGKPVVARIMESLFPPGMQTRAHSHSGPEAFYVVDGVQCVETPAGGRRIGVGESYIVEGGAHLQASPRGRRSLVLILAPPGKPWMRLDDDWTPTGFCAR